MIHMSAFKQHGQVIVRRTTDWAQDGQQLIYLGVILFFFVLERSPRMMEELFGLRKSLVFLLKS
jgi:hypothetical protein